MVEWDEGGEGEGEKGEGEEEGEEGGWRKCT